MYSPQDLDRYQRLLCWSMAILLALGSCARHWPLPAGPPPAPAGKEVGVC